MSNTRTIKITKVQSLIGLKLNDIIGCIFESTMILHDGSTDTELLIAAADVHSNTITLWSLANGMWHSSISREPNLVIDESIISKLSLDNDSITSWY